MDRIICSFESLRFPGRMSFPRAALINDDFHCDWDVIMYRDDSIKKKSFLKWRSDAIHSRVAKWKIYHYFYLNFLILYRKRDFRIILSYLFLTLISSTVVFYFFIFWSFLSQKRFFLLLFKILKKTVTLEKRSSLLRSFVNKNYNCNYTNLL